MYLNWKRSVPHVFFKWWTADTDFSFAVSLVAIFVICFLYEGLVVFRARYDARLKEMLTSPDLPKCHRKITVGQHVVRSSLFAISNAASLTIMIIFMFLNGFMCISCVAGAFAGHLTFSLCMPDEETLSKRPHSCCE